MNLVYKKMFDYGNLMSKNPNLVRLETMDYDLKIFKMPEIFRKIALDVMDGNLRYSDLGGMKQLKDVIVRYEEAQANIQVSNISVFVGNGVTEVLYSVIKSILSLPENKYRKEVLLFKPQYSLFDSATRHLGGKVKFVESKRENNFIPMIKDIEKSISDKTCAIIFANPNNPTGISYNRDFLEGLLLLSRKYNLMLISDEIYSEMLRSPKKHVSIAKLNKGFKNLVKLFGSSKDRPGMTGIRIGYCIGDDRLFSSMENEYLVRNFSINILSESIFLVDIALRLFILTGKKDEVLLKFSDQEIEEYILTIKNNLQNIFITQDKILKIFRSSSKIIDFIKPDGCNMIFFRYFRDLSHIKFVKEMIKSDVGLYAGDVFNMDEGEAWSRICVTQNWDKLSQGLERIV